MSSTFPTRSKEQNSATRPRAIGDPSPHWLGELAPPFRLVRAHAGDHIAIHRFLLSVFHEPSSDDFQASIDEPLYAPSDRVLVKRRDQIVAHVHLRKRVLRVDTAAMRVAELCHVAILPEYRARGLTAQLLEAAQRQTLRGGAWIVTTRTRFPDFFEKHNWVPYGHHCLSSALPHALLAQTEPQPTPRIELPHKRRRRFGIRLWRHVDLDSLMRLYEMVTARGTGEPVRDERYWQWLVRRRVHDRIYLAQRSLRRPEPSKGDRAAVGYAAMRGTKIMEIMTDPRFPTAGQELIARACGDAMERNQGEVELHAAPDSNLHGLFASAGGQSVHQTELNGHVQMARLLDLAAVFQCLLPAMRRRIAERGKPVPRFAIQTAKTSLQIDLDQDSVMPSHGANRHVLRADAGTFLQMIMGYRDVAELLADEGLQASSGTMSRLAVQLFPNLPFWRPPWDEVPVTA